MRLSDVTRSASFPVLGVVRDSVTVAWSEESAERAKASAASAARMDPKAPKGLHEVGEAQVLMRRGALR